MQANIDGMLLVRDAQVALSGGAFMLEAVSPVSLICSIGGGELEVLKGSNFVVVRSGFAPDYQSALRESHGIALKGLDHLSAGGVVDLAVVKTAESHIVWHGHGSGTVAYMRQTVLFVLKISATATVTDRYGNPVPQPPKPPAKWHESMRYYRHAQMADDILDGLRNLWLAVENLLDSIAPQTANEREGVWLRRALEAAGRMVDLKSYLPSHAGKPASFAYKYFYDDLRTNLFHAKASRGPSLPAEIGTVNKDLVERHANLSGFYRALLGTHTGVRWAGGGYLAPAGFATIADGYDRCDLELTDDGSAIGPQDACINPAGGKIITAPASRHPALSGDLQFTLAATFPGQSLEVLESIRAVAISMDGSMHAWSTIDGKVDLRGVQKLEGLFTFRTPNESRSSYVAF